MSSAINPSKEIVEFCLERGLLNVKALRASENDPNTPANPSYEQLIQSGLLDDQAVKRALAQHLDLPMADPSSFKGFLPELSGIISPSYIVENRLIPLLSSSTSIQVAISEPSALRGVSSTNLITGKKIHVSIISPLEMAKLLQALILTNPERPSKASSVSAQANNMNSLMSEKSLALDTASDSVSKIKGMDGQQGNQIISFVNTLIFNAVKNHASDIHLEIFKDTASLRYRIDGVLLDNTKDSKFILENYSALTTRIKIMASLDISERRLPQDGSIVSTLPSGRDIDLRVSVLPTVFGERIVMRILDREGTSFDLSKLGFPEKEYKEAISAFDASQGLILVTGPTGSGKSTTLYGALRRLNKPDVNILTAEDPVEFTIAGIGQVQIREDIGLNFSQALRSFLRQDPEVILIGEIRDKETADISIKAALTGHLVLSTLHANDSIGTVVRLVNMGIPAYLIGAALTLVIAQRLARKICTSCKQVHEGNHQALLLEFGFSPDVVETVKPHIGAGCPKCNGTGYKGRQGIYEVLKINDPLRAAIIDGASATTLKEIALNNGFRTMQDMGRKMIMDGTLTLSEYQRNLIFN